jgi:hypothetical protein
VVVFGGYGTFGLLVAQELANQGIALTIAGRSQRQAEEAARSLGPGHRGCAVDLKDAASCRAALLGQSVAVNCAGSLVDIGSPLLEACLDAGCHYTDIAVEREHVALVRRAGEKFRQRGLAAVYGCSSLPAVSGALALHLMRDRTERPRRARVTLFIGNDNPKGRGAIGSLVDVLGKPIRAPQGTLRGFGGREVVLLPQPWGRRAVFNFDSPEYDLSPDLLGVAEVTVKVGFELRLATYGFALLAWLGRRWGAGLAGWLERLARWAPRIGSSGGAVLTELFFADGSCGRAVLFARQQGQRMAALPCALASAALDRAQCTGCGAQTVYELFGAGPLLAELTGRRFELREGEG